VVYLVYELTSDKTIVQIIGKTEYLINKLNNMTDDALLIKLADRLDNVSDLEVTSKEFKKYYKEQTINLLTKIRRSLQPEHTAIISKIYTYLNKCKS
jgi:(p)ppGpp synthase/HD superfamily hydrolase